MRASAARALRGPPCARRAFLRAVERGIFRATSDSSRAGWPLRCPACLGEAVVVAAKANPAHVLQRPVPPGPQLHPVFLRGPYRSKSRLDRAPSIRRRVPRTQLPCTSTLPPLQTGNPPAARAAAQFPSCPRRSDQSSKYFSAECLPPFPPTASAAARGSAAPRPRRASPLPARQYICRVPPQSRAVSFRPARAEILRLRPERLVRRSA